MKKGWSIQRTCVPLLLAVSLFVASSQGLSASTAPDGPGALSHFDLARKDCLGTAENTSSKVWFTIANGVLSDVYYPTSAATPSASPGPGQGRSIAFQLRPASPDLKRPRLLAA